MEGYLGTTEINVDEHPEYSKYTPADWAMLFIEMYGQIDGDHHKLWVLDQVARILKGTKVCVKQARWENGHTEDRFTVDHPSWKYLNWVKEMLGEEIDGEYEYDYDEGIAP